MDVSGDLPSVPSKVHEDSPISDATIARSRFPTVLQPRYPRHSTLDHRVSIARVPASWIGVPEGHLPGTVGRIPTSLPSDPRDAVGRDPQTTRPSISWLGG